MYLALSNSLRPGGLIDPDIAAFVSASGATDTTALTQLVRYVKGESLWSNFRIYPMKSAQNAGSGATAYGIGGLTSNNITLVNAPTWQSSQINFASNQYGTVTIPTVGTAGEVTIFNRQIPNLASLADENRNVQSGIGNFRNTTPTGTAGYVNSGGTGAFSGETYATAYTYNADTTDGNRRIGTSNLTWSALEDFLEVVHLGNDFALWKNKTSITMDLLNMVTTATDCAPSDLGTTSGDCVVAGIRVNNAIIARGNGGIAAVAYYAGSTLLTTTQRETITDLINAL